MAAEKRMLFLDVTNNLLFGQPIKKDGLLRQPITCYEIAKRTYDFVISYVGYRTINMTPVMLFLLGNKYISYLMHHRCDICEI